MYWVKWVLYVWADGFLGWIFRELGMGMGYGIKSGVEFWAARLESVGLKNGPNLVLSRKIYKMGEGQGPWTLAKLSQLVDLIKT